MFLIEVFCVTYKTKIKAKSDICDCRTFGFTGLLQNQAVFTELNSPPQPDSSLTCNVDESDSRIWLRVFNSAGEKKLVLRPDTDAYTIGLPLISETNLDIIP